MSRLCLAAALVLGLVLTDAGSGDDQPPWHLTRVTNVLVFSAETNVPPQRGQTYVVILADLQLLPRCGEAQVIRRNRWTFSIEARDQSSDATSCATRAFGAFAVECPNAPDHPEKCLPASVVVYSSGRPKTYRITSLLDLMHSPIAYSTLESEGFKFTPTSIVAAQINMSRYEYALSTSAKNPQSSQTAATGASGAQNQTAGAAGAAGMTVPTASPTPTPGALPINPPLSPRQPTVFTIALGGDSATNSRLAIELAFQLELAYSFPRNRWVAPEPGWTVSNFIDQCNKDPGNTAGAIALIPVVEAPTDSYLLFTRSWTQLDVVAMALDCEPPSAPVAPITATFYLGTPDSRSADDWIRVDVPVAQRNATQPPASVTVSGSPSPVHVRWVTGVATGIGSRNSVQVLPLAALATAVSSLVGRTVTTTQDFDNVPPAPLPAPTASYPAGGSVVTTTQGGANPNLSLLGAVFLSQFQAANVSIGSPLAPDNQLFNAARHAIQALLTDSDWGIERAMKAGGGACPTPDSSDAFCGWFASPTSP